MTSVAALRQKLEKLYGKTKPGGDPELRARLQKLRQRSSQGVRQHLGGEWCERDGCRYLSVDRSYESRQIHGGYELGACRTVKPSLVRDLGGCRTLEGFDASRAVFLDTETTGLGGGAGCLAFLIGAAYFDGDTFRVRQLFVPSFDAEKAVLEELSEILNSRDFLVTFNGKSFDVNLLQSRFVLQRVSEPFAELGHLDLLHPSRVLWKRSLSDCSLQGLERRLFGMQRHEDIDSAMIPRLYYQFVHTGRFDNFDRIFRHNRLDLLSLASLITCAVEVIERPTEHPFGDPLAVARLWERRGHLRKSEKTLTEALQAQEEPGNDLLLHLGILKRRLGDHEEALGLLNRVIKQSRRPPLEAFLGVAKILEHQRGNFAAALEAVTRAETQYRDPGLTHRRHRLECRLAGRRWY